MPSGDSGKRFCRASRLLRTREFDRVFRERRSASSAILTIYGAPNGLQHSRLGLSIGKQAGGAIERNRVKRLLREAFRTSRGEIPPGFDFVAVARKDACNAAPDEVKCHLVTLASQACQRWKT